MEHIKSNIFAWLSLALGIALLFSVSANSCNGSEAQELLDQVTITKEQIQVERNRARTLVELLNEADRTEDDLLQVIASLKAKPAEIQYVVRTETKLVPTEPIVHTTELPAEHLYKHDNGLTVARFGVTQTDSLPEYEFETYELSFRQDIAVAENSTAASLEVRSSHDDVWREVPVDLSVTRVVDADDKFKVIDPKIHLGVSMETSIIPLLSVSPSLGVSLFHVNEDLDVATLMVSATQRTAHIGLKPVSYNLGSHIPIVEDVWIGPVISTSLNSTMQGGINISTKL